MSDDDAPVPASAASPMPAASLADSSLADELIDGQRAVVVAAYNSPIEAQLAKSRLDAEGIATDLLDEHTVSIGTHLAIAVGGVKVRVLEDDLERARDLLAQVGKFEFPDDGEDEDEDDALMRADAESANRLAARAFVASVFGALFFPPLNLYSLLLAWRALSVDDDLDDTGRRKTWAAVVFDVIGLAWLAVVLGRMV